MYKKIITILIIGCTCLTSAPASEAPRLIINELNHQKLPRRFHTSTSRFKETDKKLPTRLGLDSLRISSSAQFSENEFLLFAGTLPTEKILILDLRMESHGFADGIAISWHSFRNWANLDKITTELFADEHERLNKVRNGMQKIMVDGKIFSPTRVQTEEELIKSHGHEYIRLPVGDHLRPSDIQVNRFVELTKTLEDDVWLHFHCSGGSGRSTSFLVIYDMLHNADKVSFDEIILRQHLIGGKDFTKAPPKNDWRYPYYQERIALLKNFYDYCLAETELSWLEWLQEQ